VEQNRRFSIFKSNLDYIDSHNAKDLSFTVKVNQFADMTNEEYRTKLLSFKSSDKAHASLIEAPDYQGPLPKTVDWRNKGAVSEIKDQGDCGSCWAFSTSGCLEGLYAIKNTKMKDLSEQNLLDCSWGHPYDNEGCDGGDMRTALQYVIDNQGIESESDYPYVDYNGGGKHSCKYSAAKKAFGITTMVNVTSKNETALAYATVINPVSVAIDASHKSFQFYDGGIYYEQFCKSDNKDLDHGVLVVGFGDGYFLVKNSWGPGWGWEGYIYMSRGQRNNCGIATYATYAI